jgi:hypothetical protein
MRLNRKEILPYFCLLKRIIAGFLLFTFLFTQTELHQLLKFPMLVEHYLEHRAANRNISVSVFLAMHYLNDSPADKDHDRDMQLPFKSTDCCAAAVTFAFSFDSAIYIPLPDVITIEHPSFTRAEYPSAQTAEIWQPPRKA